MALEDLGENIRAARKARDLSQEALARKADVSLNLIGRIELGLVTNPHYATIEGIARSLEMTVEQLVEEPTLGKASAPPSEATTGPDTLSRATAYQAAFDEIASRAGEAVEDVAESARQAVEQAVRHLAGEGGESEAPSTAAALLAYLLASGRLTADDLEEARDALLREAAAREAQQEEKPAKR
jgi:transcriptional regulator with XRE-family HTH domain